LSQSAYKPLIHSGGEHRHSNLHPTVEMNADLNSWALRQLQRLLPIDEQSLKEVITYAASLSREDGAEHLKNLLGDSPQALEFISSFNSRRPDKIKPEPVQLRETAEPLPSAAPHENGPRSRTRGNKKPKAPLHSTGPARRPENHGEVMGGYTKSSIEEDYMPKAARPSSNVASNLFSLSQEPASLQVPNSMHQITIPETRSKERSATPPSKLPPSASGSLISDLPNVKSKSFKKVAHGSGTSTRQKATTTSSTNDLTSAIAALELSTNPSLSSEKRQCACNASIHPLFDTAPNCLSCGKIICALEGLQPCSFCNSPVLSKEQVQTMIRALKEERGQEKMAAHNAAASHSGRATPVIGSRVATPETSGDEASRAIAEARAHRDRLLAFQRENAQRTKVHDEAADFDITGTPGSTQWMSPVQRAAALKKQQKYMRELEQANRPDWEKKRTVMSMSIRNGKLVRTYETVQSTASQAADETGEGEEGEEAVASGDQAEGESASRSATRKGLSLNPLLSGGGLIRPIWKRQDDAEVKGKMREASERRETWRRVQDDKDDNEQWILDGGINGFGDGSDQVGRTDWGRPEGPTK
jgi:Putative zinc finger motif, C2HC5-type